MVFKSFKRNNKEDLMYQTYRTQALMSPLLKWITTSKFNLQESLRGRKADQDTFSSRAVQISWRPPNVFHLLRVSETTTKTCLTLMRSLISQVRSWTLLTNMSPSKSHPALLFFKRANLQNHTFT